LSEWVCIFCKKHTSSLYPRRDILRDFVMSIMPREMRGIANDLFAKCEVRDAEKFAHEFAYLELSVNHGMREYAPDYVFDIVSLAETCDNRMKRLGVTSDGCVLCAIK